MNGAEAYAITPKREPSSRLPLGKDRLVVGRRTLLARSQLTPQEAEHTQARTEQRQTSGLRRAARPCWNGILDLCFAHGKAEARPADAATIICEHLDRRDVRRRTIDHAVEARGIVLTVRLLEAVRKEQCVE